MVADVIRQAPLFAELDEAQRARVAEIATIQTYQSGQPIFREGEPGHRLFLVARGAVRISRNIPAAGEEALAILKPGACFGEMAVFDHSERSTDAIANDATTLVTISRSDLDLLFEFDRDIGFLVQRALVRQLSHRLRAANDQMKSLLAMSMF